MSEGRSLISSSRLATGDIARHSFAIVRRGFDTDEVRTYLQSVSRSIETLEEREQELRAAVADAEERAAHPVIDEATLTASLGHHSAQILRRAHEEAARIVAQAQESAANMLRETQSQVDEMQARAEASAAERVVEIELTVANAEQEARDERGRILGEAATDADEVIAGAKEEGRALLEQVQEARRRILADLTARRRTLGMQIEKLRAARDEMAGTVHGARTKVDEILLQLERTDDAARAAAAAAGDQMRLHGTSDESHDVVEESAGETASAAVPGAEEDASQQPAGDTPVNAPSVDELFARIRAGSDAPEPAAEGAPGQAAAEGVPGQAAEKAEATGGAETSAGAESGADQSAGAEAPAGADHGTGAPEAAGADAPDPAHTPADGDEPAGPDAPLVARREELLAPVTVRLSRGVKRTLGDEQNRMLDLLRSSPSTMGDALLGPEEAQVALIEVAARHHLAEAFGAGMAFAGADSGSVVPGDAVDRSASGLARTVVTLLRRRIADGSGDPADRVSAAFREWRGERVERLVGDHATQAFSVGVLAAAGPLRKVRWVQTSASGCSDCEDNALAGAVPATESFPTGHTHPPAHAGCRCLIAPTTD
jgi:cell division septum initiation protein DivIVA